VKCGIKNNGSTIGTAQPAECDSVCDAAKPTNGIKYTNISLRTFA